MPVHPARLALAAALIALPTLAHAGALTVAQVFTLDNTTNFSATTGPTLGDSALESSILSLSGFNSALGTLTAVEFNLLSTYIHSGYASAFDTSATYLGSGYYSNDTSIYMLSSMMLGVAPVNFSGSSIYTGTPGVAECGPTTFVGTTPNTVLCNDSFNSGSIAFNASYSITSGLAAFVSLDPLLFQLTNYASFTGTCDDNDLGDNCYANNDVYWSGELSVTYHYQAASAVPEPAMGLMLLGGLGLAWQRRRLPLN